MLHDSDFLCHSLGENFDVLNLEVRVVIIGGCAYKVETAPLASSRKRTAITRERSTNVDVLKLG